MVEHEYGYEHERRGAPEPVIRRLTEHWAGSEGASAHGPAFRRQRDALLGHGERLARPSAATKWTGINEQEETEGTEAIRPFSVASVPSCSKCAWDARILLRRAGPIA